MAPKRPVPLGWGLRLSKTWGKLFYCNLITGQFQLNKPKGAVSLRTDEQFSLIDEGPLRKKKPHMIHVRHILIKHCLSDITPMCRIINDEYPTRTEKEAYDLAEGIRHQILLQKITFEEAAFAYSESSTGLKGGVLGPIKLGSDMDEEFDATAFSLHISEISKPVQTNSGYHIIQRLA